MFVGTSYLRPPNPRKKDWERDLRVIKEQGLEVVRVWIYWGKVNPEEGKYIWDEYDRFFDLCQKNYLKVLAQFMLDAPPYWVQDKYPEALYIDKEGKRVEFITHPAVSIGGLPGLCFDNAKSKELAKGFMERTLKRYTKYECLYAWDVWNECWKYWPCYCNSSQCKFQQWLKEKYKNIEKLNEVWQRSFSDFAQIKIPKQGLYTDMVDYYEFIQEQSAEWMKWRVEVVKEIDKNHLVVAHHGGSNVEYAYIIKTHQEEDDWLLTEPLDVWGVSCYLTDYWEISMRFDCIRCSAKGKPWWLAEANSGRVGSYIGDRVQTDNEIKSQVLLAFSHEAKGIVFWQWRSEIFGPEAFHNGITDPSGNLTARSELVKKLCGMIAQNKVVFDNLKFPEPQIGIIWEPRSYLIEKISLSDDPWYGKKELWGGTNILVYYKALSKLGYSIDFLNGREIGNTDIPSHIKILINPHPVATRNSLNKKLREWVKAGGILITGPLYGLYDENIYASESIPPVELQEVFGIIQKEVYYSDKAVIYINSDTFKSVRELRGYKLVEEYTPLGAETVGVWNERCVVARNKFKKGKAYMVGTFVSEEDNGLIELLGAICNEADLRTEVTATENMIIRLAYSGDRRVVFVHNPDNELKEIDLTISGSRGRTARDLFSSEVVGKVNLDDSIKMTVEARDSRILLVE